MTNRTATSVLFGFDFQANAAIVLMLENIKDMSSIRLEGSEDIEINLNNGSSILAQAKSVVIVVLTSQMYYPILKSL